MNNDILNTPIEFLKGVGPNRAKLIKDELKISNFKDLLQLIACRKNKNDKGCWFGLPYPRSTKYYTFTLRKENKEYQIPQEKIITIWNIH